MCLRSQGIDDDDEGFGGGRRTRGLSDNNGGVGRGKGIYDTYKGSETAMGAARIQGQQRRLRRCDDGPEELATMTEATAEEDDLEYSTTMMEASAEESE